MSIAITVRVGRPRRHKEGIALNIFRDTAESVLLATAYGGDEDEARIRANEIAAALGSFYCAKVKL